MFLEITDQGTYYWRTLTPNNKMKHSTKSPGKLKDHESPSMGRRTSNVENEFKIPSYKDPQDNLVGNSERLFNKANKRVSRLNITSDESDVLQNILPEISQPAVFQGKELSRSSPVGPFKPRMPKRTFGTNFKKKGEIYSKLQTQTSFMRKNLSSSMGQKAHMNTSLIKEQQKVTNICSNKTENTKTLSLSPDFDKALAEPVAKPASKLKTYKIPKKKTVEAEVCTDQLQFASTSGNSSVKKIENSGKEKKYDGSRINKQRLEASTQRSENSVKKSQESVFKSESNTKFANNIKKSGSVKKSVSLKKSTKNRTDKLKSAKQNADFIKSKSHFSQSVPDVKSSLALQQSPTPTPPMLSPPTSPLLPSELCKIKTYKRVRFEEESDEENEEVKFHAKKCRPLDSESEESGAENLQEINFEKSNDHETSQIEKMQEINFEKPQQEISDDPILENDVNSNSNCMDTSDPNCDDMYENTVNFEDGENAFFDNENFPVCVERVASIARPSYSSLQKPFNSDPFVLSPLGSNDNKANQSDVIVIDDDDDDDSDDDIQIYDVIINKPNGNFSNASSKIVKSNQTVEKLFRKSKAATQEKQICKSLLDYKTSNSTETKEKELLKKITSQFIPVCVCCNSKSSLMTCQRCDQTVCRSLCKMQHNCV